tara:strand:+ start:229 stop:417 length:189 start_codon:yes stop_codon:yes gene_type:complete
MKKIILTIGVLGLLCSCSLNQNTNELSELKSKIVELESIVASKDGYILTLEEDLQYYENRNE